MQTIYGKTPSKSKQIDLGVIKESYERLKNVWKVGKELGFSGQYIHNILSTHNLIRRINYFTEEEKDFLVKNYKEYRSRGDLDTLAKMMCRTKQFICRKAKELGLTDMRNRAKMTEEKKMALSMFRKEYYISHEHPRGFLNHKHTDEAKRKISLSSKKSWNDPNNILKSNEMRLMKSDRMMKLRANGIIKSKSNRCTINDIIGGKSCEFKSSWEYNIALKLEDLKEKKYIKDWFYEKERFFFNDVNIGIRSYLPDFNIILNNGDVIYIEVKGWKTSIGMERIEMFKKRFANKKLYIIDEHEYKKCVSETDYLRRYTEQI